ncbi:hypothetical protein C8P63_10279 [Melghirimyces profundicolus]|uniref:Outer membrane lipoprotein-sorting protein n=1 Tax=Melghirimyces profundicolus TaxID=1242148 RepID=A0A2T6C8F1_9BACL|nr:DUF6612 family protein [Melghirimyces profundicolus]PTX64585.1 hypothetical protein C8P63_10279 [Melghirimyces profundicolus]
MRKTLHLCMALLVWMALISGCSPMVAEVMKEKEEQEKQKKENEGKKEKKKELDMNEVLLIARKEWKLQDSLSFDFTAKDTWRAEGNGFSREVSLEDQLHIEEVIDSGAIPGSIHMKGTRKIGEKTETTELYLTEDALFAKKPTNWVKMPFSSGNKEAAYRVMADQGYTSPKYFFDEMVTYNGAFKKDELRVNHKNGVYILSAHLKQDTSRKYLTDIYKSELSEEAVGLEKGDTDEFNHIKDTFTVKEMQQRLWIDDQTFHVKKMDFHVVMEYKMKGLTSVKTRDLKFNINGKADPIVVPDHIKNTAVQVNRIQ